VPEDYGPADYPALRTPFTTGQRLGTRAFTLIRVNAAGQCHFTEHRFGPLAAPLEHSEFSFTPSPAAHRTTGPVNDVTASSRPQLDG
jgi:uncharacterized protein with NRDE domain